MKRVVTFVMTMFLGAGLALAQTGGDKSTLNPQPLPPGRHPAATPDTASATSGKKAGKSKKGHKGGKKSKKGSGGTTPPPK